MSNRKYNTPMQVDVLLGLQWGDEGKGKVVDVLTPRYDVITRFQGGPNAGHTLEFNNIKHVLHTIPSGIFRGDKVNVIGNGVVIDPSIFKKEIESLRNIGFELTNNLLISKKAHLILPTHRLLDAASEAAKGASKIGSTLKGIGPTYRDKIGRDGLRIGDILHNFEAKYRARIDQHIEILEKFYNFDYKQALADYEKEWFAGIEVIRQFQLIDSEHFINNQLMAGKSVIAEGAQGTMLDIDFGSYPFVTSSNTIAAGACTGLGIAPDKIGRVYGIFKAYCTRVGSGPFPTELLDETGEKLRRIGNEFGSTTGRPRRCGWLDLVALRYAIMINGVTDLIMMKADVLDSFETIRICTAYLIDGVRTLDFPNDLEGDVVPQYDELEGWQCDLTGVDSETKFPAALSGYIRFIEAYLQVPVTIVSVGPDRSQTIER
ncbi:MAG: adenylosuccinate synthase [Marinilabiliales bacterium]|nr:adenylosuccinate synthase [Marinilabiliales bacterium]